ncbi:MAG: CsbD family protein [Bryobacterales bacterium]|nr:CsbD family protein [Bryobacterales bacterium]
MNWDILEGKWQQIKGAVREKWGELTDSDMEQIGGNKDRLLGKLQERYGYSRDEAERALDEWDYEAGQPAGTRRYGRP